jgi:hypothetical protein
MNMLHTLLRVSDLEVRIAAYALVHSARFQKARNTCLDRKVTRSIAPAASYGGAVSEHKNKMKAAALKTSVCVLHRYTIA